MTLTLVYCSFIFKRMINGWNSFQLEFDLTCVQYEVVYCIGLIHLKGSIKYDSGESFRGFATLSTYLEFDTADCELQLMWLPVTHETIALHSFCANKRTNKNLNTHNCVWRKRSAQPVPLSAPWMGGKPSLLPPSGRPGSVNGHQDVSLSRSLTSLNRWKNQTKRWWQCFPVAVVTFDLY